MNIDYQLMILMFYVFSVLLSVKSLHTSVHESNWNLDLNSLIVADEAFVGFLSIYPVLLVLYQIIVLLLVLILFLKYRFLCPLFVYILRIVFQDFYILFSNFHLQLEISK